MSWRQWSATIKLLRRFFFLLSVFHLIPISFSSEQSPYRPLSHLHPQRSIQSAAPLALIADAPIDLHNDQQRPISGSEPHQQRRSASAHTLCL
uniref:Secreted protein n=1 Tax=Globodera pallida TaxID=36090 RepID=A0A183BT53_GLOPA